MSVNVQIEVLDFLGNGINVNVIKETLYGHYSDILFMEGLYGFNYKMTLLKTPNFYTAFLNDRKKSYAILDDPETREENLIALFKPYCKPKEVVNAKNS